ncbi:MAG: hypothetical protein FWG38_01505 [Defluviitaleaceae bacterium]|nr:hypothetical protein [Defluviitaleaceae bacterium]
MKKLKTNCHVCTLTMKTPGHEDAPKFCEFCGADLLGQMETGVLSTNVSGEAGGVKADLVTVIVTNKRIIFTGEKSGKGATLGWILGGLIGSLIASAISSKQRQLVSVKFEDITLLDVQPGTKLLNKNSRIFTIHDKDGNTYTFAPGRKEADEWEAELRRGIA